MIYIGNKIVGVNPPESTNYTYSEGGIWTPIDTSTYSVSLSNPINPAFVCYNGGNLIGVGFPKGLNEAATIAYGDLTLDPFDNKWKTVTLSAKAVTSRVYVRYDTSWKPSTETNDSFRIYCMIVVEESSDGTNWTEIARTSTLSALINDESPNNFVEGYVEYSAKPNMKYRMYLDRGTNNISGYNTVSLDTYSWYPYKYNGWMFNNATPYYYNSWDGASSLSEVNTNAIASSENSITVGSINYPIFYYTLYGPF